MTLRPNVKLSSQSSIFTSVGGQSHSSKDKVNDRLEKKSIGWVKTILDLGE